MAEIPKEPTSRGSREPKNIVYSSRLFRVEEVDVGKAQPYVFVDRIGAVTILPIARNEFGHPVALTIDNERDHYGMSPRSLPSGNLEGGFEDPESAVDGAVRELGEETGYAPRDPGQPNIEVFKLPGVSTTLRYPRMFAVMRDLVYQPGLKQEGGSEKIALKPTDAEVYVDGLVLAEERWTYSDVHLAFIKADRKLGRDAVNGWLGGDITIPGAYDVPGKFEPWLQPLTDAVRPPA